jgi:hypothetical protein
LKITKNIEDYLMQIISMYDDIKILNIPWPVFSLNNNSTIFNYKDQMICFNYVNNPKYLIRSLERLDKNIQDTKKMRENTMAAIDLISDIDTSDIFTNKPIEPYYILNENSIKKIKNMRPDDVNVYLNKIKNFSFKKE